MHCEGKLMWAKRTWSGHSGQAWSSAIHQIMRKKHIRKTVIFLQESILLTPSKFVAWSPKLRSTARRAVSSQVIFVPSMRKLFPNDVRFLKDDVSPITLVFSRPSHLNFVRFIRANRSPETLVLLRLSHFNFLRSFKAEPLQRSRDSNFVRFFRANRSPETTVYRNVAGDLGLIEVELCMVFLRLRYCRSGNSLKRGLREPVTSSRQSRPIFTTLQSFLGWENPRRGRRSHGSGLCRQISIASFVSEKFSVSILASSQKWATATPQKPRKKLSKELPKMQVKSPFHTFHVVQVREFWFSQSQRQQNMLQRLLLATGLHSPHRFASDIHSFKQRYNCDCKSCRFSSLKSPSSREWMDLGFNVSTKSMTYIAFFRWVWFICFRQCQVTEVSFIPKCCQHMLVVLGSSLGQNQADIASVQMRWATWAMAELSKLFGSVREGWMLKD